MPPRLGIIESFVAGALALLTFHQPFVAILDRFGLYPVAAYVMDPTLIGLPLLVQQMLWSGAWVVLFAKGFDRWLRPVLGLAVGVMLYCATVPIAFLFLVLAPAQGHAIAFAMPPLTMLLVIASHIVWGLGVALWLVGMRGLGWVRP